MRLNAQLLIKIQSMINKTGVYDDFYRHYANKDFYVKPLLDYVTGNTIVSANTNNQSTQVNSPATELMDPEISIISSRKMSPRHVKPVGAPGRAKSTQRGTSEDIILAVVDNCPSDLTMHLNDTK